MKLLSRIRRQMQELGIRRLTAGIAWTVSYGWLTVRGASWLGLICVIFTVTVAGSFLALKFAPADGGISRWLHVPLRPRTPRHP